MNSQALYDTITSLHQGLEYRLGQTVQQMRYSLEPEDRNLSK